MSQTTYVSPAFWGEYVHVSKGEETNFDITSILQGPESRLSGRFGFRNND